MCGHGRDRWKNLQTAPGKTEPWNRARPHKRKPLKDLIETAGEITICARSPKEVPMIDSRADIGLLVFR